MSFKIIIDRKIGAIGGSSMIAKMVLSHMNSWYCSHWKSSCYLAQFRQCHLLRHPDDFFRLNFASQAFILLLMTLLRFGMKGRHSGTGVPEHPGSSQCSWPSLFSHFTTLSLFFPWCLATARAVEIKCPLALAAHSWPTMKFANRNHFELFFQLHLFTHLESRSNLKLFN